MELLIFRTDIKTKKKVKIIKPFFNKASKIIDWSIDTEDIDNILRIEGVDGIKESDIIHLTKACGFYCKALD